MRSESPRHRIRKRNALINVCRADTYPQKAATRERDGRVCRADTRQEQFLHQSKLK